jgi:hypothetical protein
VNEALVLVPEMQARRALAGQILRLHVVAPPGAWIGCGRLRVLRVRSEEDGTTSVAAGYESYVPA